MGFNIEGKIALVTGANRGIGKAIVESFIQHGAKKVYIGVRSPEKANALIGQFGNRVIAVTIDYNNPKSIAAAATTANDVEVVVSNAGILKLVRVLDDSIVESLEEIFKVNVYGLLRMAKAFAPVLKSNGGGAFVQLNSVASFASFADFVTYCASKAAAYSLTQALKDALAEQGTQVLSVHPGPVSTDMAETAGLGDMSDSVSVVSEGIVEALKTGDFHLFPDKMAKQFEFAYKKFAQDIIEAKSYLE